MVIPVSYVNAERWKIFLENEVDMYNNLFLNRRICVCRRKTCSAGDICYKDRDCGYLQPLGSGKTGTCETVPEASPWRYKK